MLTKGELSKVPLFFANPDKILDDSQSITYYFQENIKDDNNNRW